MKSKFFLNTLLFLSISILTVSCAKKEEEPIDNSPLPTPKNYGDFKYTLNGVPQVSSDSAYFFPQQNSIFSYKSNASKIIEINLSAFSVGTYTISSATGNQFQYSYGQTIHNGTGTLAITANNSNLISGNFNCILTGGTYTSISGTFVDLPKK